MEAAGEEAQPACDDADGFVFEARAAAGAGAAPLPWAPGASWQLSR